MEWPTQSQFNAGFRYAGGYVATGGAVIATMGLLPADKAHAIVDAAQKVLTDLQQLVGDSYLLGALVFPIAMGVIAKMGWNSASTSNQKQSVMAAEPNTVIVKASTPEAATAAASAAALLPQVSQVLAAKPVADAAPSDKVVAK
jgi:hypothetical protein